MTTSQVRAAAAPAASSSGWRDDQRWRTVGMVAVLLAALVPPWRMLGQVIGGSALQYGDYWLMLPRFTSPDGGLQVGGLFEFQSQPVVVPQFLYWLNVKLFSGSNTSLGLLVMALALGQLAVIGMVLRRSTIRPVARAALFLLASALIFDLNGTWSFAKSMSGTAWLSANLCALLAVHLRSTDRRWAALALAAVAAASYGTGLAAWPAVAAAGFTRLPVRQWWREWPAAVGFVATFLWYRSELPPRQGDDASLTDVADAAARLMHLPFGLGGGSQLVGYTLMAVTVVLAIWLAATTRTSTSGAGAVAAWVGLATYGLVATLEIAQGRNLLLETLGLHARYTSLPALTWLGCAGLVVLALGRSRTWLADRQPGPWVAVVGSPWAAAALVAPVLVAALAAGDAHVRSMEESVPAQELREVATRIGVIDETAYLIGGPFSGGAMTITPLLSSIGHHPFVDDWGLDCGLLDLSLPAPAPGAGTAGAVIASERVFLLRGTVQITGEVPADRDVDCIVVADEEDRVVGAATVGIDVEGGRDDHTGFRAFARPGSTSYRAYVVYEGDPSPIPVGEAIPAAEIRMP